MTSHRNLRRHADPAILSRGPFRTDTPACYACGHDDQPGFVGFADDRQSPYIACGGDPTKHQRTPVGAP